MKNPILKIFILMLICSILSCTSTHYLTNYNSIDNKHIDNITVLTENGNIYELNVFSVKDSTITGKGTYSNKGVKTSLHFDGSIKFSDIKYISKDNPNTTGTIFLITGLALLVTLFVLAITRKSDPPPFKNPYWNP